MFNLNHSLRLSLLTCLILIPSLTGCQSRSHPSPKHLSGPVVVREVVTTNKTPDPAYLPPAGEKASLIVQLPDRAKLSPAATEVVKLHESMVGEEVVISFVESTVYPFRLSADQIVYLQDIGLSEDIVQAMIKRDTVLASGSHVASTGLDLPVAAPSSQADVSGNDVLSAPAVGEAPDTRIPVAAVTEPVYAGQSSSSSVEPPPMVTSRETRVVTREYFHEQLAPYGTWVHLSGHGWCWRPTVGVTDTHWRPYTDNGRWVYSDHGWYWHSYYTWGWAPFHYGRWTRRSDYGWVWVPDTVWGPSWVTWRYSDAYCGWAPLPPAAHYHTGFGLTYRGSRVSVGFGFGLMHDHYAFVPRHYFTHHHVGRHRMHRDKKREVYNQTTIINNYNTENNHVVINNGITPKRIAAGNTQEIQRVPLKEVEDAESVRLVGNGRRSLNVLPVYRPKLPTQSTRVSQKILHQQNGRSSAHRPGRSSLGNPTNGQTSSTGMALSGTHSRPPNTLSRSKVGTRSGEANLRRSSAVRKSSNNREVAGRDSSLTLRSSSVTSRPTPRTGAKLPSGRLRTSTSQPRYVTPSRGIRPSSAGTGLQRSTSTRISSRPLLQPPSNPVPRMRGQEPVRALRPSVTTRSRQVPSRQTSRTLNNRRSSSGTVRQRSSRPPTRAIPKFRSSSPAVSSRSSSGYQGPSSSSDSSSSRPSRPGR
jgi:hypothetical protein